MISQIRVTIKNGVGILMLAAPRSLNVLSEDMKNELRDAVPKLVGERDVRAILISGEGENFCAGGDIRGMDDRHPAAAIQRLRFARSWLEPLLCAPKPVVAAVNGKAAGAGFALSLAADLVLVERGTRFKAGFPRLGLVPDYALAYTLSRLVGVNRAKHILMTNREVGAEEAMTLGIACGISEDGKVFDDALALATELAKGPTLALGLSKRLIDNAQHLPLGAFLDLEAASQGSVFGSHDFEEGVEAFRAKREPHFTGS